MVRLKFIGLLRLSYGGNPDQQGRRVTLMWPQPFVVVWRHFYVAGRNFEEILQHLLRWHSSHSAEVNENINLGYSQDQGYS